MTTLIKLTTAKGSTIWVNPNYISTIFPLEDGGGSACYIGHDENPIIVRETPETIIQKISVIK